MTSNRTTLMAVAALALFSLTLTACASEVGSPECCEDMKKKD